MEKYSIRDSYYITVVCSPFRKSNSFCFLDFWDGRLRELTGTRLRWWYSATCNICQIMSNISRYLCNGITYKIQLFLTERKDTHTSEYLIALINTIYLWRGNIYIILNYHKSDIWVSSSMKIKIITKRKKKTKNFLKTLFRPLTKTGISERQVNRTYVRKKKTKNFLKTLFYSKKKKIINYLAIKSLTQKYTEKN